MVFSLCDYAWLNTGRSASISSVATRRVERVNMLLTLPLLGRLRSQFLQGPQERYNISPA